MWPFRKQLKSIESAILGRDLRAVKKHLSLGLDVNASLDARGSRPIHYGVNSSPEVLRLLIEQGADVNIRTSDGQAPIHTAAATANSQTVLSILMPSSMIYLAIRSPIAL